jgi:hypothetical protein
MSQPRLKRASNERKCGEHAATGARLAKRRAALTIGLNARKTKQATQVATRAMDRARARWLT